MGLPSGRLPKQDDRCNDRSTDGHADGSDSSGVSYPVGGSGEEVEGEEEVERREEVEERGGEGGERRRGRRPRWALPSILGRL